jgi:elongation factor 1-beta
LYLHAELPEKNTYPNLHYWYLFINTYTPNTIQRLAGK